MPIKFLYMAGVYLSVFVRPCASRPLIDRLLVCVLVRERDVVEWQVAKHVDVGR